MNENRISFRKTRIAPTPSGYLHLGNVYSFALTAALARKHNAQILLRIDDLDRERVQKAYVQDIFDTLHFLDIPWHEGPRNYDEYEQQYSQVHRMRLYNDALEQLKASGAVFACNCSRAQVLQQHPSGIYQGTCLHKHLPFDTTDVCWRLHTRVEEHIPVKDLGGNTVPSAFPAAMQYFVVRKKDGYPAYQLASVIDDLHLGIDMVVRGADLRDSTLAQQYLAQKLQLHAFGDIAFHHHPLMMDTGSKKLSKSDGATSVQYLRRQGKKASDIYAMVSNMTGFSEVARHWQDFAV
jgi:glutamyl-tRNA synthetase